MLIQKMKYMKNLTTQEKSIVDYILKQPGMVFEVTAQELARLTYTSSSTVVRLCKKLGVKGYPDFQLKMALDYPQRDQERAYVTPRPGGAGNGGQAVR
ncbi:MurR/RpiR family transcriptional regulator [Paenibacillus fonticola]|uniref:MurR/RpiR family transcriptional regulator n=1 Tax=Paenibacillus fonticola TaxID=379896 RepID=UPI00037CC6AE|nr:MurR/RpiR family transcriptional regulator [Paenibacillus fonticola]